VHGSCEHGNGLPSFMKDRQFLDRLRECQFLNIISIGHFGNDRYLYFFVDDIL
jgi:hypothetical protein